MSKQWVAALASAAMMVTGCGKAKSPEAAQPAPSKPEAKAEAKVAAPAQASTSGGAPAGSSTALNAAPAPKPPSTGNEMPAHKVTMPPEKAKAIVDEAVALFGKPTHDCAPIANALTVALPIAFPQPSKDELPGLHALAKCSQETKHYRAEIAAAVALLELGDDDPKTPAKIVSALAEMGEYDKAIKAAPELAKKFPKSGADLMAALTFVYCRAEAWDACLKTGTAALKEMQKIKTPPNDDAVIVERILRDLAWIVTGKPKDALADVGSIERSHTALAAKLDKIKEDAELAIARGYYLEVTPLPQLPLGVYHLMGRQETGALVTLELRDHKHVKRTFRVEAEVVGVTERSSNTIELEPGASIVRWVNPPLKMDFEAAKVRSPRPSQLALKLVELTKSGEAPVIDETINLEVLPRDYLPLKRRVGADSLVPTYGFVGAWITSNDPAVDAFLGKAKLRAPGHAFVGEQDATAPQVQALYDELKAHGVSYVMDPEVTSEQSFVQRTRLPADVLASTNAQCLEGTLLFATLMEAVGIKPIVVIVPGHAFVGWHTVAKDGTNGEPLFVETTMVGEYGFVDAVKVATARVAKELKAGSFDSGAATIVDIEKIRGDGFTAQPL